jgi:hypothetical protein
MLPQRRVFTRAVAAMVAIAQLVVVLATATEPLRASATAHVERCGTQRHFAHNEATCQVCASQSMHARTEAAPVPAPIHVYAIAASIERIDRPVSRAIAAANGSRAPPALS